MNEPFSGESLAHDQDILAQLFLHTYDAHFIFIVIKSRTQQMSLMSLCSFWLIYPFISD